MNPKILLKKSIYDFEGWKEASITKTIYFMPDRSIMVHSYNYHIFLWALPDLSN